MLESGKLAGFLATTDYDKAREFYEGKLGFEFVSLALYALVMRVGDTQHSHLEDSNFTPRQLTPSNGREPTSWRS
jgi:catechol 2,3-dioxygenase-like lactoylglutathione lyase family enzyme